MGYADCCPFLHELDTHRELVAQEFDTLLGGAAPNARAAAGPRAARRRRPTWRRCWSSCRRSCANASRCGSGTRACWRCATMPAPGCRAWSHAPRSGWSEGRVSEEAALRMADWIEPLLRRESYLALLLERPGVHERLLRLLGAARWPARYLLQHPGVIDELASDQLLSERFNAADFERELEQRRRSLQITGEDDDEALLNLLRRAHHAEVFRTLARDVEGRLTVEQVADELSALADAVLRVTARWCWQRLKIRHRETPQFAIIGYGKLGGKELGYGSDLDIVFVYEDEDERAPEAYAAFVRKLINWLTTKTAEGDLFEIDTALRPNGSSGLLITTFEAYANYQQRRGSNTAWTWEHQAMTRARFVLGEEDMADACQASSAAAGRPRARTARAVRRGARGRDHRAARRRGAARRNHRDAREGARGPSGQGRPFRRQAQPRRDGRCRVRGAVPGAVASRPPSRADPQCRQHRFAAARGSSRPAAAGRRPGGRQAPTASCGGSSTRRG